MNHVAEKQTVNQGVRMPSSVEEVSPEAPTFKAAVDLTMEPHCVLLIAGPGAHQALRSRCRGGAPTHVSDEDRYIRRSLVLNQPLSESVKLG